LGAAGVSAVTIGDLPGALCGPAQEALGGEQFTTLMAALNAAKDVEIGDLPTTPLVVVAPTNDAFAAALKALDVTAEDLLADTDTLASILSVHVGAAANDEATSATDLAKSTLTFMVDGKPAPLASTWPTGDAQVAGVSVMGPVNPTDVSSVLSCKAGNQTIFVADSVLLPTSLGPGPKPAPMPSPMPMPSPKPSPTPSGSATATSMMASAGALVLGALQFL